MADSLEQHPAPVDRARAERAVVDLLAALGDDVGRPGLTRTPQRVVDLFTGLLRGMHADPCSALGVPIPLDEAEPPGSLVGLSAIPFRSVCEHHLLPFDGYADVYYSPRLRLAGLSKIATLVEAASGRLTLQETIARSLADTIMKVLDPYGVVVRLRGTHRCVGQLEPQAAGSTAVSLVTIGSLPDVSAHLLNTEN